MKVEEKLRLFLDVPYLCDSCLGRQFGQLMTGMTNAERGKALRTVLSMIAESEGISSQQADSSRMRKHAAPKPGKCFACGGLMEKLDSIAKKAARAVKVEYETFLIGIRLSSELLEKEEKLWEMVGIEYCEPIKEELSREIGKRVDKATGKRFSRSPDVEVIISLEDMGIEVNVRSVFIYGEYQKLVRNIPQTRWPSGKYRSSVEEIIGRPFKKAFGARDFKLHAAGREDVDARCLGWRPFVLELVKPKKRKADLKEIEKLFRDNARVRIRKLRYSSAQEMREIKEKRFLKEYVALVETENEITRAELRKLKQLEGKTIRQRTPLRVMHRRSDKIRKRKILKISAKYVDSRHFILRVAAEAGTYIKELISSDKKRTSPSVSDIIGPAKCIELDVVRIWDGDKK